MMSIAIKNIMVRVIKNRMGTGENIEDILSDYPRLTKADKEELKNLIQTRA